MKRRIFYQKSIWLAVLTLIFLAQAQPATAFDWKRGHYSYKSPYFSVRYSTQYPHHYYRNKRQHHSRPHYDYHYGHKHGSLVALPHLAKIVLIGGKRYRHHHGTYYQKSSCGYYAVPDPYERKHHTKKETTHIYDENLYETSKANFVIHIRNINGGYTAVEIRKKGEGFLGPQGEYYPEFPKVAQLKVMYGK